MGERKLVSLVLLFISYLHVAVPETDRGDVMALLSLKNSWQNRPLSWSGSDPCGDGWDGIKCVNSRVDSIVLSSMDLAGQIPGDIGFLSELVTLDLSYNKGLTGSLPPEIGKLTKLSKLFLVGCGFTGPIPDSIGSLQQLVFLSLNFNRFSGTIPASIGNLSNLNWLDLTENQLEGPIPVSSDSAPGLDLLLNAEHFHLGKNKLSGKIPPRLFSSEMKLIHVLFDSNKLSGSIPSTLGLVQSLQLVRFDYNSLTGYLPENINNLTNVQELRLSNNQLSSPLPNLSGMINLTYLDMSNNSFHASDFPPWLSTLWSLTTLMMENTQLGGHIPIFFFNLPKLQTVVLKSNGLNGTLDIGTTHSKKLQQIELQHNQIENLAAGDGVSDVKIILAGNPICLESGSTQSYNCSDSPLNISYTAPPIRCSHEPCLDQKILSPNCKCAYPYIGTLTFRTASPGTWDQDAHLEKSLMEGFEKDHLPIDSVYLDTLTRNPFQDLQLSILVFPLGQDCFNQTGISSISSSLTVQAYYFIFNNYEPCESRGSSKPSNTAIIIGAAVSGSVMIVLLLLAGIYVIHQRKRAEKAIAQSNPFEHAGRRLSSDSKSINPQWKVTRPFSFSEVQKYTDNFSQANDIGSGGYGKVYRGTLPNGQLVAIKRSQRESKQGENEFKAEIELLSRVHHKNLVRLVGFCFDRREQMLVYEYVPNGTLRDTISGKSGIRLDWTRRLKVALGAARGLTYLHEHVNPPIIHRDVKSTNILLDERLNAKVADFGLSKLMADGEKDHVTTQVKGTMGYLDPDYYTSQQLTEKSDVYSFGVMMLELITARKPIEKGSYIVKVVRNSIDKTKELYGLHETLDPILISGSTLKGFKKFVDLSMKCLEESRADRPKMSDVVKELEDMLQLASLNATAESAEASTSSIYDEITKGSPKQLYSNESFDSTVAPLQPKNDPK